MCINFYILALSESIGEKKVNQKDACNLLSMCGVKNVHLFFCIIIVSILKCLIDCTQICLCTMTVHELRARLRVTLYIYIFLCIKNCVKSIMNI